jgi:multiple sugar transport system ATP-binding protein
MIYWIFKQDFLGFNGEKSLMASVEFNHVCKTYPNGKMVLDNFNLTIKDGEFLVLVGPSGCGKSTILRILAGLEDITTGKLLIGDEIVNRKTPQQRNIAMVFQNYALYPHMTVGQNLEFPLRMMKLSVKKRQKRLEEVSQMLGLSDLLQYKPKQLSGGQRQRVAMGRAMVRNPDVFLMDEPLSNLDAKMRVQIRSEIAQLQQKTQKTMVYVTHDQVEAMTMGERVAVLWLGQLQQVAPPQELYDRPNNVFVADFIGSPSMNIWSSQLQKTENGTFLLEFGSQLIPIPQPVIDKYQNLDRYLNQSIFAGLRPETFLLCEANNFTYPTVTVKIQTVEVLGHEILVYFHVPVSKLDIAQVNLDSNNNLIFDSRLFSQTDSIFIARISSSSHFSWDKEITLAIDMNKLYLFTAEKGQELSKLTR